MLLLRLTHAGSAPPRWKWHAEDQDTVLVRLLWKTAVSRGAYHAEPAEPSLKWLAPDQGRMLAIRLWKLTQQTAAGHAEPAGPSLIWLAPSRGTLIALLKQSQKLRAAAAAAVTALSELSNATGLLAKALQLCPCAFYGTQGTGAEGRGPPSQL